MVPALAAGPLDAAYLLAALPEQLPHGGRSDGSILFWREAAKLLLELLARGSFLPTLLRSGESAQARWTPIRPPICSRRSWNGRCRRC